MGLFGRIRQKRRFDGLIGPQLDGLYRFARSLCRDPVAAEDLLQEATMNAMTRIDQLRDDAAFGVWVHRVLYTTHLDHVTREQRHRRRVEAVGQVVHVLAQPATPDDDLSQRELGARLAAAIDALPDDPREAVWLVDVEGMAFGEAAEVLGLKVGTVASRVARGRAALRERLSGVARERGVGR